MDLIGLFLHLVHDWPNCVCDLIVSYFLDYNSVGCDTGVISIYAVLAEVLIVDLLHCEV